MTTRKPEKQAKKTPPPKKHSGDAPERPSPVHDYREIFDASGIASVVIGEGMEIIHANSRFVEISGFALNDLEGKKRWTDFVAPEDLEKLGTYHSGLTTPGLGTGAVFPYVHREGWEQTCNVGRDRPYPPLPECCRIPGGCYCQEKI